MEVSMTCKCNIGKRYEMMEHTVTINSNEYPETLNMSPDVRLQYLQGKCLLQMLIFKVSIGYVVIGSNEYKQQYDIIKKLCFKGGS